jgi:hypothetical protein
LDEGAAHVTDACPLPGVALTLVGDPGTAAGVTLLEAADAGPVPDQFVAVTVNVYAVPFVKPLTVAVVLPPETVAVKPPGEDVALYDVIAAPPLDAGAVQLTDACPLPAVAVTFVGAPGGAAGVTLLEAVEAGPFPAELVAVTVNV